MRYRIPSQRCRHTYVTIKTPLSSQKTFYLKQPSVKNKFDILQLIHPNRERPYRHHRLHRRMHFWISGRFYSRQLFYHFPSIDYRKSCSDCFSSVSFFVQSVDSDFFGLCSMTRVRKHHMAMRGKSLVEFLRKYFENVFASDVWYENIVLVEECVLFATWIFKLITTASESESGMCELNFSGI